MKYTRTSVLAIKWVLFSDIFSFFIFRRYFSAIFNAGSGSNAGYINGLTFTITDDISSTVRRYRQKILFQM